MKNQDMIAVNADYPVPSGLNPDSWQWPAHTVLELSPRRHRHCLVIPVINEGLRIRKQLEKIASLNLPVDIVIADGGSTDGSLDPEFLRSVGVSTLLVKTGPGKLSAQLRMGFAYAVNRAYDGVVAVDGNGKDGVEAVGEFLNLLDLGYDFVQGSRYVAGGVAINTPLDRHLAVKLIHAPLVSLSAGRRYTDTTNGFRGFSRALLVSAEMAVFRNCFMVYNLHYYIAIRASRIGLKICETPVSRAYPPKGKTPTKISGFRGRMAILDELFGCMIGRFNP